MHVAALLMGFPGLFAKLLTLPPLIIVFGRVCFATLTLIALLNLRRQHIRLHRRSDYAVLLLSGVLLAVHWAAFFQSIQVSNVAIGVITASTFPVFVAFLEPLAFGGRVRPGNLVMALVLVGGVAITVPRFELTDSITQGVLWGLLSSALYAVLAVLNKHYVRDYSSLVITFYQDAMAMLVLFPIALYIRPALHLRDIGLLLLLGSLFTAVAHALFIKGIGGVEVHTASIINAGLEVVYGIVFAAVFLAETPTARTLIGGAVILAAAVIVTLQSDRPVVEMPAV